MSAQITWTIEWMQTTPTTATPPECVVSAGWRCTGQQETNGVTYTSTIYGQSMFTYAQGDPFTPYTQLTQQQVLDWCWQGGVNKAQTEAAIQTEIDSQITPATIQPPLPWAPQP